MTTLVSGQNKPTGVAADSNHIYWADGYDGGHTQDTGTIMEANLDGTGVTTLASGLTSPLAVALTTS